MLYVMLAGAYPFERPEDKHDAQKLQKMIQRILKVEYELPPHVKASKELRDLLARILVPDPAKRARIADIQAHPWYQKDLPPGVAEMNDNLPAPGPGVQSVDEIARIVREAQAPPAGPAGWENDEFIDSTMDAEVRGGGCLGDVVFVWGVSGGRRVGVGREGRALRRGASRRPRTRLFPPTRSLRFSNSRTSTMSGGRGRPSEGGAPHHAPPRAAPFLFFGGGARCGRLAGRATPALGPFPCTPRPVCGPRVPLVPVTRGPPV